MYTKADLEDAYKSVLDGITQYPITQPIEQYSTKSIILYSARFVSAPQMLNVLLWKGKLTVEQHVNLYDLLQSDDPENWLVVFTLIQTLKDEQEKHSS